MTILLQWLVEHAWIFYALCVIGIIPYAARALAAQREQRLAMFTLERETATAQIIQAWTMVFVFIAIGVAIFAGTTFVLPNLSSDNSGETRTPTPTPSSGIVPPTLSSTSTPSPTLTAVEPTTTSIDIPVVPPPAEPAEPTEPSTPTPTNVPVSTISGGVNVRFGDFAELTSYSLPAAEFSVGQSMPLTIYWQGLVGTSPLDYWVFTHLMTEDGRLIAQHDGVPAGGTRPTSGWSTGETIIDLHSLVFQDTTYTGPARISIGLYDPSVGRVLTQSGVDHVVLPVVITILP
ncbi:MAG: hypothetical protein GY832_25510 [Chloroflexi bacterium]|nr:hypothetical protein [Chloroflexota bacterium]